ncbi:MAG: DUF4394 domain-containing protein [Akkermansiaceae bacterium]|nr:DUF4394 domain-containing protein [Verrucomicrobiales bacterium]
MKKTTTLTLIGGACLLLAGQPTQAATLVGLYDSFEGMGLYTFDSSNPFGGSSVFITGLGAGEKLLALDRRPLTGQIYGLSSGSALYTINTSSGLATKVGSGFTTMLTGTRYGFDFNPVIDRIRIVGNDDQNIVAHPDTGAANIATTTPVFYGLGDANNGMNPNVVQHAYDNNFAGTGSTQLRGIDVNLDILVTQANNAGTLGTIGALGINATENGGFDVDGSGAAFAAFADGLVTSSFYSINLASGAATKLGELPGNIIGLTVVPEPSVLALASLGALALMRRRSRK